MESFEFGFMEVKNRPTPINKRTLKSNLLRMVNVVYNAEYKEFPMLLCWPVLHVPDYYRISGYCTWGKGPPIVTPSLLLYALNDIM